MKTWIIYRVTHLETGKSYVGMTYRTLDVRKSQHVYAAQKRKTKSLLHKAIALHGEEKFSWDVIEENITSDRLAIEREMFWIVELRTHVSVGGYNLTFGGEGTIGHKLTPEQRQKIGDRFRGIPKSPEQRAKMGAAISAARKGKKLGPRNLTPEQRERMSAAQRGKKRTGGWKHNAHAREKQSLNSPLCKSVTAVSTVDGSERVFRSQTEAGKSLGLSSLLISECCRGLRKEAGGYYWRFTNDSNASSGS